MLGRFTPGPVGQLALAIFVPGIVVRYVGDKYYKDPDRDRAFEETYQKYLADIRASRAGVDKKTSKEVQTISGHQTS